MAGFTSVWVKANGSNGLIPGCTLRANSSNTRCWYCISVTKRAAWKRRSPFQPSAPSAAGRLAEWKLALGADGWNGERLFQAARFVTEMQYQHLVFEEFARKVQPGDQPVRALRVQPDRRQPGHHRRVRPRRLPLRPLDADRRHPADQHRPASHNDIKLLDGFLNPAAYYKAGPRPSARPTPPASIIMGLSDQVGQEIDEFVVNTLRNNLLGLPLDLPSINMARARSEGIPPLNDVRRQIFASTNDGQLTPYTDWIDFGQQLKHPESLVNFIAAYGTHTPITMPATSTGGAPRPTGSSTARSCPAGRRCRRLTRSTAASMHRSTPARRERRQHAPAGRRGRLHVRHRRLGATPAARPPPVSTTSTCGSVASPSAPTCSAACWAARSTTSSRTSSPTCRTATGSTTWPAPRA